MPQVTPIDPREPGTRHTLAVVVETSGPPASIVASVRRTVHDIDPTVPTFNVEAMSDVIRASTARLSLTLTLMSAGALITLLLSAIGLYGVMAYTVALRMREFGIRVALGAEPRTMAGSVARQGLRLIAAGVLAGLMLFGGVGPFLRAFLYGVTFTDPVTLTVATCGLTVAAALAIWIPARRAAQVDPAEALRSG
jgi:ABC-type antimicrobial peptide transport system permease subunit